MVHSNIIIQYKRKKCTFSKLIYIFIIFYIFYLFRTRRFIFKKTVIYTVMVWYVLHTSV